MSEMNTDQQWELWGQRDPYFGVLTDPSYRKDKLDDAAKAAFFESGQRHVDYVLGCCRSYVYPVFNPRSVLDFGCGVGRLVLPFARQAERVVGLDISQAMLDETRANCVAAGLDNVVLAISDDDLQSFEDRFELVHTSIVLQHIDVPRGRRIFARLIDRVLPGGMGAIQVTYAKAYHPDSYGQPVPPDEAELAAASKVPRLRSLLGVGRKPVTPPRDPDADPEMLMNPYNLNELMFMLQSAGVARTHVEFTDHGGELGVFLFFQRPAG